jgi:hypothetical protein
MDVRELEKYKDKTVLELIEIVKERDISIEKENKRQADEKEKNKLDFFSHDYYILKHNYEAFDLFKRKNQFAGESINISLRYKMISFRESEVNPLWIEKGTTHTVIKKITKEYYEEMRKLYLDLFKNISKL